MYYQTSQIATDPASNFTFYQRQSDHQLQTVQEVIPYESTQIEEPSALAANQLKKLRASQILKEAKKQSRSYGKTFSPQSMPALNFPHTPKRQNIKMIYQQDTHADESEETDMNNYNQLTLKLQTALNKISSQTKKLNKTMGNCNGLIRRFQECEMKKRKEIDRKKEEIERQSIKQVKKKPTIDKRSEKITREAGYEPIYTRFQKIMENKKKKVQEIEALKIQQEEDQLASFIEEYNKHAKRPDTVRTYEEYYNQMQAWKQRRQEENRLKVEAKQFKQLEGITFQPKLNPNSQKMVSAQQHQQQRLPIDQRGLIKKKTESNLTFTPQTNHKKTK